MKFDIFYYWSKFNVTFSTAANLNRNTIKCDDTLFPTQSINTFPGPLSFKIKTNLGLYYC